MALPWLRIFNAVVGISDMARVVQRRVGAADSDQLAVPGAGGPLEARLAGVVVAALKEAFDRDHLRLELEREHIEAERRRGERMLRLELSRQAGDRELGRLRLLAGLAAVSWLGTVFLAVNLATGAPAARAVFGVGWLLLLAALAASFVGQSAIARDMSRMADPVFSADAVSSGPAGVLAPWLVVSGLAIIGLAILMWVARSA